MARLFAVGVIWLGCCIAWVILGSSLVVRTRQSSGELTGEVRRLWGPPGEQAPPRATYEERRQIRALEPEEPGKPARREVVRTVLEPVDLPLERSEVRADFALEHRRKGLLWFPTYGVEFAARYAFTNPTAAARDVKLRFPLDPQNLVFDDFQVLDGAGRPAAVSFPEGCARWQAAFGPGETRSYSVHYRSRGTTSWTYRMTTGTGQVKNFHMTMETDFPQVDFPPGSLSPTRHAPTARGWRGEWTFGSLVANAPLGLVMPERLNPGPLAARITFFAPVGLLFFFFVVAMFAAAQGVNLHPMHYLLLGCAFFAFHLLFAYLVDHLSIAASFTWSAAASVFLVVSYARLFTGWRFAAREMGVAQLLYLVLFSFTFFWKGFTGLAITIGAVLTLFVMMQYTGRTNWEERFRKAA